MLLCFSFLRQHKAAATQELGLGSELAAIPGHQRILVIYRLQGTSRLGADTAMLCVAIGAAMHYGCIRAALHLVQDKESLSPHMAAMHLVQDKESLSPHMAAMHLRSLSL